MRRNIGTSTLTHTACPESTCAHTCGNTREKHSTTSLRVRTSTAGAATFEFVYTPRCLSLFSRSFKKPPSCRHLRVRGLPQRRKPRVKSISSQTVRSHKELRVVETPRYCFRVGGRKEHHQTVSEKNRCTLSPCFFELRLQACEASCPRSPTGRGACSACRGESRTSPTTRRSPSTGTRYGPSMGGVRADSSPNVAVRNGKPSRADPFVPGTNDHTAVS